MEEKQKHGSSAAGSVGAQEDSKEGNDQLCTMRMIWEGFLEEVKSGLYSGM